MEINNTTRKILHEDIEYIQSEKKKSIIHLKNGDTEIISKGIDKVVKELDRKYFVKCAIGYVVNIHNIDTIHRENSYWKTLRLVSGAKISLTGMYSKNFLKYYSLLVPDLANLKSLED